MSKQNLKFQNLIKIIISFFVGLAIVGFFFIIKNYITQNNMLNKTNEQFQNIRPAAVAGQFYPSDKKELEAMVDNYLEQATTSEAKGMAKVIIVPHAGYVYSGRIAAWGFKQLQGSGFERAIIIGRSHQQYFAGVVADSNQIWQTPLGNVAVDTDFIEQLVKNSNGLVRVNNQPHQAEHSLEVEVPFLQKVLGDEIKIVPLLFGDDELTNVEKLAEVLARMIDEKTTVIISSDLSHYPDYQDANYLDQQIIEAILGLDVKKFQRKINELMALGKPQVVTLACAEPAIITGMLLAKTMGLKPQLLKYANSGDYFPETQDQVVGYTAIEFYSDNTGPSCVSNTSNTGRACVGSQELGREEQKTALQIARDALEAAFEEKDYQLPNELPKIFQERRGVFVTLKKQGGLRGCIGNFSTNFALAENIKEMALAAAFDDARFLSLEKAELEDTEIEISVLSPMQKITNPDLIELGKHGVYLRQGSRSGVYLPQVAEETGWTKEQFLDSLCEHKAGLSPDCWRDDSTELFIFTAQIFAE